MTLDELKAKTREKEEALAAARAREAANDVDGGHDDEATDDVFN